MQNKFTKLMLAGVFGTTLALPAFGDGHSYGPFPITLKGYSGDKTNSVSYSGQIARHVLHDSLKTLSGTQASTNSKQITYNNKEKLRFTPTRAQNVLSSKKKLQKLTPGLLESSSL